MEIIQWIALALCGSASHYLKQMVRAKKNKSDITFWGYWSDNLLESCMSIIGTVALFLVALEMNQMNGMMAFATGVMGNSAVDLIGNRADKIGGSS